MIRTTIIASLFAGGTLWGQTASPAPAQAGTPAVAAAPYRNQPVRIAKRAGAYYGAVWGVEALSVKAVESGEIIRFSYRVLDPERAIALNDKKAEPALISPEKRVKLIVPSLEQVGLLRQTPSGKPEPGKSYWMAFSNSGRVIKRGDRVNVVIGQFRAEGLTVE
jgi:hypothetical protein